MNNKKLESDQLAAGQGSYALWVGCNVLEEGAHCDVSIDISVAGTKWQRGLVKGLCGIGVDVQILTDITYAPWPRGPLIPRRHSQYAMTHIPTSVVPYVNIPRVKQNSKKKSYLASLKQVIQIRGNPAVVLFYNYSHKVEAAFRYLRETLQVPCYIIAADYPGVASNAGRFEDAVGKAAGVAFLSWDSYQKSTQTSKVHIDGGVSKVRRHSDLSGETIDSSEEFVLMYSGSYAAYCGIDKLVELVRNNQDQRLRLCLTGNCSDQNLLKQISQDSRIHYHGFISDSELRALQARAGALISVYLPDDADGWGRFPSKLLEYLSHLKPVISSRAPGISPEYDDILHFFDPLQQASFDKIVGSLVALSDDEKQQIAKQTYDFLAQNKLWEIQAKRLLTFVRQTVTELEGEA